MSWFYANSVTITNGQTIVTVNSGEDISLAQTAGGLIVGGNPPVEIKRSYLGDGGQGRIELLKAWPYANQNSQPAYAFPTDGDFAQATEVLRALIDGFTIATQAEMQGGTDNTHLVTALRAKQAIDFWRPAIADTLEFTSGKFLKMGSLGIGKKLDLRASTTNYYATHFETPTKAFNKGTSFGFIGGGEVGITTLSATDYGIFINHSHWDDVSGGNGSAYQQFLHATGTYFRVPASPTAWTAWKKNINTGDFGFGTNNIGIVNVMAEWAPITILNNMSNGGSDCHYNGMIKNHAQFAPEPWGIISGFITSGNNYSYSYQDFTGINGDRYRRRANGQAAWTTWKKVLEQGNYGVGGTSLETLISNANTITENGTYRVGATWTGSPFVGTDGTNQGYLTHTNWSDNSYCIQTFFNVNGAFIGKFRRKDFNTWSAWKDISELDVNYGLTRSISKFDYATNVDMNNLTKAGWYKLLANPTNSQNFPPQPPDATGWWYVQTLEYNEGAALQQYAHAYVGAGSTHYTFVRGLYGGSWSNWQRVNGPTIGVTAWNSTIGPIGAVIERGSNANGEYVKYADGTMICYGSRSGALGTTGYSGISGLFSGEYTWFFPATFANVPVVTGHGADQSRVGWCGSLAAGPTQCNVVYYTGTSSPNVITYVTATGRWR